MLAFLHIGGPSVWILVLCTVLILWIALEKILLQARVSGSSPLSLQELMKGQRLEGCRRLSYLFLLQEAEGAGRSPLKRQAGRSAFMKKAEQELSRGLPALGTVSVISPFIGLFGTVAGIMHAFSRIASEGRMSPEVVGSGIAEALITTAAGLLVAILSVILYNVFKTLLESRLADLEILADQTDADRSES
ncbi:MAG: MotA/TolQ/ExbB proton channel family protein [bacterium]